MHISRIYRQKKTNEYPFPYAKTKLDGPIKKMYW